MTKNLRSGIKNIKNRRNGPKYKYAHKNGFAILRTEHFISILKSLRLSFTLEHFGLPYLTKINDFSRTAKNVYTFIVLTSYLLFPLLLLDNMDFYVE